MTNQPYEPHEGPPYEGYDPFGQQHQPHHQQQPQQSWQQHQPYAYEDPQHTQQWQGQIGRAHV